MEYMDSEYNLFRVSFKIASNDSQYSLELGITEISQSPRHATSR